MKQSESLDLASSRRSFIFGVGAFAAGIFLPVKKLYFPVANSLVLPRVTYMWMVTERIPTKIGPKGYSEEVRYRGYWREKTGSPPVHPREGKRVTDTLYITSSFQKSLEKADLPGSRYTRFENWDCVYYKV